MGLFAVGVGPIVHQRHQRSLHPVRPACAAPTGTSPTASPTPPNRWGWGIITTRASRLPTQQRRGLRGVLGPQPGLGQSGRGIRLSHQREQLMRWMSPGGSWTAALSHKLQPGTVIPAGGVLYLSPNVAAFRARATAPQGRNGIVRARELQWASERLGRKSHPHGHFRPPGLQHQFPWARHLWRSNTCGLRKSCIIRPPLAGSTNDAQSFEYLKLKNISATMTLDLAGVRLTNGVYFNFSGSAVTEPASGQNRAGGA